MRRSLMLFGVIVFRWPVLWGQQDPHEQLKQAAQLEQQSQFAKVIDLVPGLIASNLLDYGEQVQALIVLGSAYEETGRFTDASTVTV